MHCIGAVVTRRVVPSVEVASGVAMVAGEADTNLIGQLTANRQGGFVPLLPDGD